MYVIARCVDDEDDDDVVVAVVPAVAVVELLRSSQVVGVQRVRCEGVQVVYTELGALHLMHYCVIALCVGEVYAHTE